MPIDYRLFAEARLVWSVATGVVQADEIEAVALAQKQDPGFRPDFRELVDLRQAEHLEMTPAQVFGLVQVSPFGRRARRAFVAPRAVLFGMARMYEGMHGEGGAQIRVFRQWEEALTWLGFADGWTPDGEAAEGDA